MAFGQIFSIALSGLNAAQTQMSVAANNLANMQTDGFRQQRVELATAEPAGVRVQAISEDPNPGPQIARNGEVRELSSTDIAENLINLTLAKTQFRANLYVLRVGNEMLEELFSLSRR